MRRQLNWMVLAVTSLVVISFVVPLGLVVRRQAEDRAKTNVERLVQQAASVLAVTVAGGESGELDQGSVEGLLAGDLGVILPGGAALGVVPAADAVLAEAASGRSASGPHGEDWVVAVPVATRQGIVTVVGVASADELSRGVATAWVLLALLALALIVGAVLVADRLGRSVTEPASRLSTVARRLGEGDLTARFEPAGPPEVLQIGEALNDLAIRLDDLIASEREALADLSHRLRTPLTSLRLQAESMTDQTGRGRLLDQINRTQRAVDALIHETRDRGRSRSSTGSSDLAAVAEGRVAFWAVLAEDQQRKVEFSRPEGAHLVSLEESRLGAAIDALVGNVFAHTPAGCRLAVTVEEGERGPVLLVEDDGPGFPPSVDAVTRGESGAGSTGLGLDIARRAVESTRGVMTIERPRDGGARVRLAFGPVSPPSPRNGVGRHGF